ncbi:hypothetical protein ARMGADRAFT_586209 [Armillaria gallica]|uniref:Uncharacterized protein n=1 Tax=Armillaria gallica TaxID=47427 RepID=A0A2H3EE08_ARMGA|nr:hypothetical protein ARMGADRAFT_586209 [Armillaria gallica]
MRRNGDVRWRRRANDLYPNAYAIKCVEGRFVLASLPFTPISPISYVLASLHNSNALFSRISRAHAGYRTEALYANGVQLTTSHQHWGRREKRLGHPLQKRTRFFGRQLHVPHTSSHACSRFSMRYGHPNRRELKYPTTDQLTPSSSLAYPSSYLQARRLRRTGAVVEDGAKAPAFTMRRRSELVHLTRMPFRSRCSVSNSKLFPFIHVQSRSVEFCLLS